MATASLTVSPRPFHREPSVDRCAWQCDDHSDGLGVVAISRLPMRVRPIRSACPVRIDQTRINGITGTIFDYHAVATCACLSTIPRVQAMANRCRPTAFSAPTVGALKEDRVGVRSRCRSRRQLSLSTQMKTLIADHKSMLRHSLGTVLRSFRKEVLLLEASDLYQVDTPIGQHTDVGIAFLEVMPGWRHHRLNGSFASQPEAVNCAVRLNGQGTAAMRAIPPGVSGPMTKNFPKACIEKARRLLPGGEAFFSKDLLWLSAPRVPSLSPRQPQPDEFSKSVPGRCCRSKRRRGSRSSRLA